MRWLSHPLREWTRTVVGEQPKSGAELDALYQKLGDDYPFISISRPRESAEAVASALIGTAEGAGSAVRDFVSAQAEKAQGPSPLGRAANYGVRKADRATREGGQFLALAGLLRPPDPEATKRSIEQVTLLARANRTRLELESSHAIPFPKLGDFAAMSEHLIGINRGTDRVGEVRIVAWGGKNREVEVHAFDEAGHHVLDFGVRMKSPGVLYIHQLQAAHGRNCDRLHMAFGGGAMPGRGNSALIAAGLEALIIEGAKAGLHAIATTPGSPQVQRLYEKMGFTSPGAHGPWRRQLLVWAAEKLPIASGLLGLAALSRQALRAAHGDDADTMILDLTDAAAVKQALVSFQLARARFNDVPKGVARKMEALGQKPDRPNVAYYRKQIPDGARNTRVVSGVKR